MSITEQIDWLIKKVNELFDKGCGCDCNGTSEPNIQPFITPNLKFRWNDDNSYAHTYVSVKNAKDFITTNILQLELNIENYNLIKDYNPILIIDRYKGRSRRNTPDTRRSAGFKHEHPVSLSANGRVNEIPITSKVFMVDLKPETYFNINPNSLELYPKGIGINKSNSNLLSIKGPRQHFGFRIRMTIDGKTFDTDILTHLRAEIIQKKLSYKYE